ncbi:threonine/serine exporter ThrE family protein [Erysipelothrix urinaevulpis]|uniref:threonine/serine ThrE exporter family protein n=1 Tax=Erysipelothrix urinaevulpis TaxID=2683717 RepID=UPI0013575263|nr:threonine/serine exporter family protein [Erysipelothrix urinaevulpis]
MDFLEEETLLDACILAGKILMENGAEMHRVEDTMNRILDTKLGEGEAVSFVIPTGIFVTTRFGKNTKMKRIVKRRNNLQQISNVNALSRQFSQGLLTTDELYECIVALEEHALSYPYTLQIVAAGILSSFMMLIFQGDIKDFLITAIISSLGYALYLLSVQTIKARFIQEFIATFAIGILAGLFDQLGLIQQFDTVLIGSIIILVPGIPITNSIRDFLVGNTISGTVFMLEALLIAGMIGAGAMTSLYFF